MGFEVGVKFRGGYGEIIPVDDEIIRENLSEKFIKDQIIEKIALTPVFTTWEKCNRP